MKVVTHQEEKDGKAMAYVIMKITMKDVTGMVEIAVIPMKRTTGINFVNPTVNVKTRLYFQLHR